MSWSSRWNTTRRAKTSRAACTPTQRWQKPSTKQPLPSMAAPSTKRTRNGDKDYACCERRTAGARRTAPSPKSPLLRASPCRRGRFFNCKQPAIGCASAHRPEHGDDCAAVGQAPPYEQRAAGRTRLPLPKCPRACRLAATDPTREVCHRVRLGAPYGAWRRLCGGGASPTLRIARRRPHAFAAAKMPACVSARRHRPYALRTKSCVMTNGKQRLGG